MLRYGGHVAAAGLEIEEAKLEALREAFVAHAGEAIDGWRRLLDGADRRRRRRRDARPRAWPSSSLAWGRSGRGNPELRLLVPSARISDVRPMGEGDRHARFSLASAAGRAAGVAFGVGDSLSRMAEQGRLDLVVKLEMNEWNGAIEPRVVLERALPIEGGAPVRLPAPAAGEELWKRIDAALAPSEDPGALDREMLTRRVVDAPVGAALATVTELASSGEPTLVICADAVRRAGTRRAGARSAGASAVRSRSSPAAARCSAPSGRLAEVLAAGRGAVLADWRATRG